MRAITIIIAMFALTATAAACGGDDSDGPTPSPTLTPTQGVTPTPEPASAGDLARAVVQIEAIDFFGDTIWTGSGTFISSDGMILTNAHVVDDRFDEYETLGVAVTDRSDAPPELLYEAEIAAVDYALDLAVIEVVSTIDGGDVDVDFPFIQLGDSDVVEIGDDIRILG